MSNETNATALDIQSWIEDANQCDRHLIEIPVSLLEAARDEIRKLKFVTDQVETNAYAIAEERDQLKAELEAVREERDNLKWHDAGDRYPPSNEEVDIAYNGLESIGHMNSFNQWLVKDTPIQGVTHWRFRVFPRQALAQKGGE
ncbi:hypothetical protein [Bremerella sp. P1]|uniref:hypothetical protein n=1 Tax=Bremerella sp. P1 TaxID=3026424 RepID=UPI0023674D30|nr:hypothetical protein [Bremerella sp. P1]WDI44756.1 hypothetical protein PSR63_12500 [Bremerella sp. P1]